MITVYTTVSNRDEASRIARRLVEERLAACVNTHQIGSIYRWEDEVVEQSEIALDIKTSRDFEEVKERLVDIHPYDVPAVLKYEVEDVHEEYKDWVDECSSLKS